jgi:hypothetical protein
MDDAGSRPYRELDLLNTGDAADSFRASYIEP